MDEASLQEKLTELLGEIQKFPELEKKKAAELCGAASTQHTKLKKSVANLQDSLDYLRLTIKYLAFDLEATKRENRVLRSMLEEGS